MRRVKILASLALFATVASCANIAGLSGLDEVDGCVGSDCPAAAGGSAAVGGSAGTSGEVGGGGPGGTSAGGKSGAGGASGHAGSGGLAGKGGASGAGGTNGGTSGSAGSSGSAGTAGASGSAGSSGHGGAAGKGGTGGAAGNAGKAGSSGVGGNGGMACEPKTCALLDATCGVIDDGCGHMVGCGTVATGGAGGTSGAGGSKGGAAGAKGGAAGEAGSAGHAGTAGSGGSTVVGGTCKAPFTCGAAPGAPNNCGCVPGATICNGDTVERCTADGQLYIPEQACSAGACTPSGCNACSEGTKGCLGDQTATCSSDGGSPPTISYMPSGPACGPGLCNASSGTCTTYVPGAYSCVSNVLNLASTDGQSQTQIAACATPGLCAASLHANGVCAQPVCAVSDRMCVTTTDGMGVKHTVLRGCNADRTGLADLDTCDSAALCDATMSMCIPPACPVGDKKCNGGTLLTCNADQTGYNSITCAAPTPTCDPMKLQCGNSGPPMVAVGPDQSNPLFYIDATEVTDSQYQQFIDSPTKPAMQPPECGWNNLFTTVATLPDDALPVTSVDWCDAWTYCAWAGKHLCGAIGGGSQPGTKVTDYSTDEWTRACEGNLAQTYSYGSVYEQTFCNEATSGPKMLEPVETFPKCTANGIFDVIGNAAEWEDGCTGTTGMGDSCPTRGGAFDTPSDGSMASCTSQLPVPRNSLTANIGFRCCAE